MNQRRGVRLPTVSVGFEVETCCLGVGMGSTTENCPCQRVPHPGIARDCGQGESLLGVRDEDLRLVVSGDQNTCKSPQ